MLKEVSDKEDDLLEILRMARKSYPNGYERFIQSAQEIFDELVTPPGFE